MNLFTKIFGTTEQRAEKRAKRAEARRLARDARAKWRAEQAAQASARREAERDTIVVGGQRIAITPELRQAARRYALEQEAKGNPALADAIRKEERRQQRSK